LPDPVTYPPEIDIESTQEAWDSAVKKYSCDEGISPEQVFEIGVYMVEAILEVLSHL
jgi:hypothetical protein